MITRLPCSTALALALLLSGQPAFAQPPPAPADPKLAARAHFDRGVAAFNARRFAEGKQQFELHRTVNPRDVENAVWHFACVARSEGLEAAQKQWIEVSGDGRIPMAEIHDLFSGKGDVDDVLEAVREATGDDREKRSAEFYGQLYLGLYYDLHGKTDAALTALRKAVAVAPPGDKDRKTVVPHLPLPA